MQSYCLGLSQVEDIRPSGREFTEDYQAKSQSAATAAAAAAVLSQTGVKAVTDRAVHSPAPGLREYSVC